MKYKPSGSGFTLIELLVVISIIALLSSVLLLALRGVRNKGQDSSRIEEVIQVRNALELYAANNASQYPAGNQTIESLISGPLSLYIKSTPSNLSTMKNSLYASNGRLYEIFVSTQTGAQFNTNNGCGSADYTNYDTTGGNSNMTYCVGNNTSGATLIASPIVISISINGDTSQSVSRSYTNYSPGTPMSIVYSSTGTTGSAPCNETTSNLPGAITPVAGSGTAFLPGYVITTGLVFTLTCYADSTQTGTPSAVSITF